MPAWVKQVVHGVLLLSLSLGQAPPVNAEEKPGFLLVNASVTNFQKLSVYGQALPSVYAKFNGAYVVVGGVGRNIELFDGTTSHESVIFTKFNSKKSVETFWWSDEYRAVVPLRDGAGRFDVVAVEGTGIEPYPAADGAQPAYVFTYIKVKDREKMMTYMEQTAEIISESPGRVIALARPDDVAVLEGPKPDFTIEISSWPNVQAFKDVMDNPAYKATKPVRDAAMDVVVLVAEVAPAPQ